MYVLPSVSFPLQLTCVGSAEALHQENHTHWENVRQWNIWGIAVSELTSARETLAGKVFRMSSTAQMLPVAFRVCGELSTMIHHHYPNILQCKGVSLLVNWALPGLLME